MAEEIRLAIYERRRRSDAKAVWFDNPVRVERRKAATRRARLLEPSNPPPSSEGGVEKVLAGVPEWPKGSDCKSDAKASVVRIHPPAPDLQSSTKSCLCYAGEIPAVLG